MGRLFRELLETGLTVGLIKGFILYAQQNPWVWAAIGATLVIGIGAIVSLLIGGRAAHDAATKPYGCVLWVIAGLLAALLIAQFT